MEGKVEKQKGLKWKSFDLDVGERRKSEPARWMYRQCLNVFDSNSMTYEKNGLNEKTTYATDCLSFK